MADLPSESRTATEIVAWCIQPNIPRVIHEGCFLSSASIRALPLGIFSSQLALT
jgi:hypothetical protein